MTTFDTQNYTAKPVRLLDHVTVYERQYPDGPLVMTLTWIELESTGKQRRKYKSTKHKWPNPNPPADVLDRLRARALADADAMEYSLKTRPAWEAKSMSIPEAQAAYLDYMTLKGLCMSTREAAEVTLGRFADAMTAKGARMASEITQEAVNEWCEDMMLGRKAATANGLLSRVGMFLTWAGNKRLLSDVIDLKPYKRGIPQPKPLGLEDSDIAAVLAKHLPVSHEYCILWLLASCGLRVSEACDLTWDQVRGDTLTIQGEDTKTKCHQRVIPFGPKTQAVLGRVVKCSDRLFPGIERQDIAEAIGTKDAAGRLITPKRFRQWFRQTLERGMTPDYAIRALMGHKQPTVQASYANGNHWRPSDLLPAMLLVESRLP